MNGTRRPSARTPKGAGLGLFCPTCHDHTPTGSECENCRRHRYTLDVDKLAPVTALNCHHRTHPIRNDLHNYKRSNPRGRYLALGRLASLIGPALDTYHQLGALIVPVPSTRRPRHVPVADIISAAGHTPFLLLAATRAHPNRTAAPDLFTSSATIPNRPIVVVDDCYVTGSTAQAAAHTLKAARCPHVVILTIGRRYRNAQVAPTR